MVTPSVVPRLLPLALAGALSLAACVPGGTGATPGSRTQVSRSSHGGIDDATMTRRLEAIPGVRSVELKTTDGFDTGHYVTANLEVGSRDETAAIKILDQALAIMWQGPQEPEKRALAWVPDPAAQSFTVADELSVDRRFSGSTYTATMTRRYGPWPGRGTPPGTAAATGPRGAGR